MIYQHLINSRALTSFKPGTTELAVDAHKNYLFDLDYLGLITLEATGTHTALQFLQGQLTCDVSSVTEAQMVQGAQCDLKGRILSLMDVFTWHGVHLVLAKDMMEATLYSLKQVAQLSRIRLKVDPGYRIFGFYLQNTEDLLGDLPIRDQLYAQVITEHYCAYHLGHGLCLFIVPNDQAHSFSHPFIEKNQLLGSYSWHNLALRHQQLSIYPESRGLFLPHRLGLHHTAYLSFNKGCYKGQEIIARMHYKGTLKHELKRFIIKTDQNLASGQKLLTPDGAIEVGELIDYAPLGEQRYLVAVSILKEHGDTIQLEGEDTGIALETYT